MQVSRHWRLNSQRYRLEGVRYENNQVSLQQRPVAKPQDLPEEQQSDVDTTSLEILQKVAS